MLGLLPQVRGDRFMKELDLVAVNVLTLAAANAAVVYLVSPTRAAPAPGRWEWQNALARLPNNVFEASLPQRTVTSGSRVAGFLAKSAELCGVGVLAGACGEGGAAQVARCGCAAVPVGFVSCLIMQAGSRVATKEQLLTICLPGPLFHVQARRSLRCLRLPWRCAAAPTPASAPPCLCPRCPPLP